MSVIARAAQLISQSKHAIALTGAGISTPSGIPDFRSPNSGLWTKADPTKVASLDGFLKNPRAYYEWRKPLLETVQKAQPNPAHLSLAALEAQGRLRAIITQNIDGLHQRGGAKRVLEVHGRSRELICLACHTIVDDGEIIAEKLHRGAVPHCDACGGLLKPNVVFFGELLPSDVLREVAFELRHCDLVIVVGSSLEVHPACDWPLEAVQRGARSIIVNYQETYFDQYADVVIHDDVAVALPAILATLT